MSGTSIISSRMTGSPAVASNQAHETCSQFVRVQVDPDF